MQKKSAVGIVIAGDRWDLTQKTLQSLYHTDEPKSGYDLYLINNGCSPVITSEIKQWVQRGLVPIKNIIRTKRIGIGPAWNLFLDITRDYHFRTKLDNDLVFANTPVAVKPYERKKKIRTALPSDAGTNPGAVPVASFIIGAGKRVVRDNMRKDTCFLQHLEEKIKESDLGICALPAIPVGVALADMLPGISALTWREQPCLIGACMTISKSCFDRIGYFDDDLPCFIDKEYSQRAMGAGINVGYVDNYCVIHIGADIATNSPNQTQQNEWNANKMGENIPFQRGFVHTKWEKVHSKLSTAAAENRVVNLL